MADILERIPLYDGGCKDGRNHRFRRLSNDKGEFLEFFKCRFCGMILSLEEWKKDYKWIQPLNIKEIKKMASVNHCFFMGRLGKDPEIFETTGGNKVASFNLGLNKKWKKDGQWMSKTEWVTCKAWNKYADLVMKYLAKGMEVYVETEVGFRIWSDENSVKHYSAEFNVKDIQFIGKKKGAASDEENPPDEGGDNTPIPSDDNIPF